MDPQQLQQRVTPAGDCADVPTWWMTHRPSGPGRRIMAGAGWAAGAIAADAAIDAGAGVLLLLDDAPLSNHARAVTAIYCGIDASLVACANEDSAWMRQCADVRDLMPALRACVTEPLQLLEHDPLLAWHTACIAHAAARRTPVVIAGAVPQVAALCAQRVATAIVSWVHWGFDDADPAAMAARTRLARAPWFQTSLALNLNARASILGAALEALDDSAD